MRLLALPLVFGLGLGACAFEEANIDSGSVAVVIPNGQDLNGQDLNGQNLNGQNLNGGAINTLGKSLVWAEYRHVKLDNHDELRSTELQGSELIGHEHHHTFRGEDFAGARLEGRSDTGRNVKLMITDVIPPTGGSDVWHYMVEYKDLDHHWYPLCHDANLTGFAAIAVDGWWNYQQGTNHGGDKSVDGDHFTFACPLIGAIGKCVDAGYEPWDDALEQDHEACVRLLRADYCGDGISHTTNGALVNIYDNDGIQGDTETWTAEGEWDADGARCITPHIREAMPVTCYDQKLDPTCGNPPDWDGGSLIVSETP